MGSSYWAIRLEWYWILAWALLESNSLHFPFDSMYMGGLCARNREALVNCEGSKLGWLGRSSNGNRQRRGQVGTVVMNWVSHSLALVLLSVSLRHGDTGL